MKPRVLPAANAAIGAIVIGLALFGLPQSKNVSDRESALGLGARPAAANETPALPG